MLIFEISKVCRRGGLVISRPNHFPSSWAVFPHVRDPSFSSRTPPLLDSCSKKEKQKTRREERRRKPCNPSPQSRTSIFQLCFLPHRTSVSRTTTSVGKLALPPTRRMAPLAGKATHGGARRPKREGDRENLENLPYNRSPSTLNQNE